MFYSQQRLSYPIGFRNDDAATLPGMSIACISGAEFKDNELILILEKPGTTFRNFCAITEPVDCAASGYGRCAIGGIVPVKYDSGTPAFDEGWGFKPSQWTISKGFFGCCRVMKLLDSTEKIAAVALTSQLTAFLGKVQASIASGATTSTTASSGYKIFTGTTGSETDAGFTTVPAAYNRGTALVANDYIWGQYVNNAWHIGKIC